MKKKTAKKTFRNAKLKALGLIFYNGCNVFVIVDINKNITFPLKMNVPVSQID